MFIRVSYSAVALLATTALASGGTVFAQDSDPAETTAAEAAETVDEEEDRVLGPVVIRGEFIPDEKRDTSEVASLIDAEDFTVRGDGDVAAALRRATGVSLDSGGKFVYVRGLNERYTNSTLNGSILPSPEPLRKVAPLDLFPTSVLASTLVQKTFSPDMSGEFGGGMLDIRTVAVPNEDFLEVGFSVAGDTATSFSDGFLHDGSDTDYLGYDDGDRDLPPGLGQVLATGTYADLSFAERNAFSRELTDNSSLLVVQEGFVGPDFGIDLSAGKRLDVNPDLSVGLLGAFSYSNSWTTKDGTQGIGEAALSIDEPEGPVTALSQFDRRATTNTIGVNGLASVGLDLFANHELKFLAFGTRSTDKETEVAEGFTNDRTGVRRESLEWVERQLWTTQVQGEHVFPRLLDLEANWHASYSQADRDAPYSVFNEYIPRGTDDELTLFTGTGIEFSDIADETTDWGVDFILPLLLGDRAIDLKAGYLYTEKDRESQNDFFVVQNFDLESRSLRIDYAYQSLFADGFTSFQSVRSNQSPAFYIATQEVDAGYVGIDAEVTPFLRIALGGRYEDFIQVIETRTGESTPGLITPPLEEDGVLPAATLTWNFADDLQLRLGYSETVNRPQFREVGPSRFTNTATNEQFIGNPFLQTTDLTNYDARLEWYFGRDQFLTVGAFYKELERPIEAFNVGSGESRLVTFVNIDAAEVQGLEFEFQRNLDLQDWLGWDWLGSKEFAVTTNYTYSDSSIELENPVIFLDQTAAARLAGLVSDLDQTQLVTLEENSSGELVLVPAGGNPDVNGIDAVVSRPPDFDPDRQLQGQSEHLANFQIGYSDPDVGADLNLLVNFQSERIRSVESFNDDSPAIIEEPPLTVDLVYRRDFNFYGGDYTFGLKVQNIFGDEYEAFQESGGETVDVDVYDVGTTVSFSLNRRF